MPCGGTIEYSSSGSAVVCPVVCSLGFPVVVWLVTSEGLSFAVQPPSADINTSKTQSIKIDVFSFHILLFLYFFIFLKDVFKSIFMNRGYLIPRFLLSKPALSFQGANHHTFYKMFLNKRIKYQHGST